MQCSRRSFRKAAAISAPLAGGFPVSRAFSGSDVAGVRLGVQTYSFRDMLATPGDMVGGKPTEASRTGKPPEGPPSAAEVARCLEYAKSVLA